MDPLQIYVGWDPREELAFRVCEASLRKHASVPLEVHRLDLAELRASGLYTREHEVRDGVLWDVISEQPMSTQFAISRFLVPQLAQHKGWALYCDCDFLWRADVAELFALSRELYAVMVVKHEYIASKSKMDAQINVPYVRKNWSSLMLFNCGHPANTRLKPHIVNTWHRRELHGFQWLLDWQIGSLPFEWNYIQLEPRAVHMTAGTPDMLGHEDTAYADEWRQYV